jgi:small conductance mechanosensitive channel
MYITGFAIRVVDLIDSLGNWSLLNLDKILISSITLLVGFGIYKLISREIEKLRIKRRIEIHSAYTLKRIVQWSIILIVLAIILAQWNLSIGSIAGLLTLFGSTIIGFASINTLGNAIAGLIIMTSRPFKVGDRIYFKGKFADVKGIELIYTKMITLDNILVSVPNQELLKTEIDNFGKKKIVRRHCKITPGFEYDSKKVEKILLEAAKKTKSALKEPKPYVWITNFQPYAVEYTLYVFINDIKNLPQIDADLYKTVLETCKKHKINISTPLLHHKV